MRSFRFSSLSKFAPTLLGAFVVWQLIFLLAANVAGVVHGLPPEVLRYEMADGAWRESLDRTRLPAIGTSDRAAQSRGIIWATDRWSEATAQWQGWAMFAPNVPASSYFLTTSLRWHDPHAQGSDAARQIDLPSDYEPADPRTFWQPAITTSRRFNFEWRLVLAVEILAARDRAAKTGADPAKIDEPLREWTARQAEPLRAYARVRHQQWLAAHPHERPADEVVLLVGEFRRADTADGMDWQKLPRRPLVRWRPKQDASRDSLMPAVRDLELFDERTGTFGPLADSSAISTVSESPTR
jgi:hypothetical protein